jgi:tRNA 2-thiouridine synthesizing protein A
MTADVEIDARRLFCPLPVIKLQDCIRCQAAGTQVRIVSTDPGSLNDIPTWCRISGHRVLEIDDRETEFVFLVEKGADED